MAKKFGFVCWDCKTSVDWKPFLGTSICGKCGSDVLKVVYPEMSIGRFIRVLTDNNVALEGLWRYFDFLPLNSKSNIVTGGEGNVSIDRWPFLEKFAREQCHTDCLVFAHRHDANPSTGSFKDLAASVVASALKENGIKEYVVASTGNIGVAYARYLAASGAALYAFIPDESSLFKEAELSCFGQNVFRVKGDYAFAQRMAETFAIKKGIPLAGGTFDPFRIEAKKTMVFEWYRLMDLFPDVYIQALSGGTGPLGIAKGVCELRHLKMINKNPRLLLTQVDSCAPMANSWERAKNARFPEQWYKDFDVIENPKTSIMTLATGNPIAYPRLAQLVRAFDGDIYSFPESLVVAVAKIVAFEIGVRVGPAGAVGVAGFFGALKRGLIRNGDVVVIAIGEGVRRDPDFMLEMRADPQEVASITDCLETSIASRSANLWRPLIQFVASDR